MNFFIDGQGQVGGEVKRGEEKEENFNLPYAFKYFK